MNLFSTAKINKSVRVLVYPNITFQKDLEKASYIQVIKKQIKLNMKEKPILDVIMEPGDAIWIPMYYPHEAISLTPRLSVSFPFQDNESAAHKQSFEDREWITL